MRMQNALELYPAIDPYASGFLEVSDLHTIYWEQCGNPNGVPVIILHGGPGEGCTQYHRRFFDPDIFRIILFYQRGCGRSSPHGELKGNTPEALVADIEKLRTHLSIDKWHIFGGSWGSTLALIYALHHRAHVESMILRGIFLLQSYEIEWFLDGVKQFAPKAWQDFTEDLENKNHKAILKNYYKQLTHKDKQIQYKAAIKWFSYESACATLVPNSNITINEETTAQAHAMARIEAHYFKNFTMDGRQSIIHKINKINDIPLTIIQGRYDIICPPVTAERLVEVWPNADYHLVDQGGHSMMDSAIKNKLLVTTYKLAEKYKLENHSDKRNTEEEVQNDISKTERA